jgi:hypothetical protein
MVSRKKVQKKRKPLKFKTISIKLTARQKKSLTNYCKSRRTTPNKIIKKSLAPLLQKYVDLEINHTNTKVNQLELFNLE